MTDTQIRKGFEGMGPGADLRRSMLEKLLKEAERQREDAPSHKQGSRLRPVGRRWLRHAGGLAAALLVVCGGVWLALVGQKNRAPTFDVMSEMSSFAETARLTDEFVWKGRSYSLVSSQALLLEWMEPAEERGDGLDSGSGREPLILSPEEVGGLLGRVEEGADRTLDGCPIYEYLPVGCEALVAVQRDGVYQLFRFSGFLSYRDNRDEDMSAYLELYGVTGPESLRRVEFYTYPDPFSTKKVGELTDSQALARFYGLFSQLTASSEAYFKALGISHAPAAEGASQEGQAVQSDTVAGQRESGAASSPAYEGTAASALSDSVKLRLVGTNGLVWETEYYPHIGFISRHKVSDGFAAALEEWTASR